MTNISGDQELANYCGVSKKTVQDWRGKGLPCRKNADRTYTYELAEVASFRETLKSPVETYGGLREELIREEIRNKRADADRKEREEEEARGNILPRDALLLALSEIVHEASQQAQQAPKRFKPHLCQKCQDKLPELKKLLEQILTKLSIYDVSLLRK